MAILSSRQIPVAILLCEQFIHLTHFILRPNTQPAFEHSAACLPVVLGYFLVLFRLQYCGTLGEL